MKKTTIRKIIDKVSEDQIQTALFAGLSLFVLLFLLPKYIWRYYTRANQVQEIFLILLMVFFLIVLGIGYRTKKIPVQNVSALSLIGMAVFGLISCLLNGDLRNSIYGNDFQGEGLITLITYYALFFAGAHLKKKEYRRWLLLFLYLVLGFIALFGILQYFHVPFIAHQSVKAAVLPTWNQNFYAAFPVLLLGLVFGNLLYGCTDRKKKSSFFLWHGFALLGFGACIASDSLVAYLGLIMQFVLIVFLECFRKEKRFQTIFILVAEFIIVFFVFDFISGGQASEEFWSLFNQIEQEGTLLGDAVGSGRMKIWKETLKMIPKKWAFGCGIEKYMISIGTEEAPLYYGNAHNEYLHMWAEQGLFVTVCYLIFLFSLFIPGLLQFIKKERYESDVVSKSAMIAFFGYIAQAFANIRVLQVAPYFWLCCGLLYLRKRKHCKETEGVRGKK